MAKANKMDKKMYSREYAYKPGILNVFRQHSEIEKFDFHKASREAVAHKFADLMRVYGLEGNALEGEEWGIEDINDIPDRLWEETMREYAYTAYQLSVHDPANNSNATEKDFSETLRWISKDFTKVMVPMKMVWAWDVANCHADFPRVMFTSDEEAINYARSQMVEIDGDCGISVDKVPVYLCRKVEMYIVRNYTPHDINVYDDENNVVVTYPSMGVARVTEKKYHAETIDVRRWNGNKFIPITYKSFGEVTGLPNDKYANGRPVLYIVSGYVKSALPDRHDLITPDDPVRDADGRIIGCRGFSMQW